MCVSRLIVFALVFLSPCPPLSHLLFFFFPGPRAHLKRKTMEKNNYLILFAFRGSLETPLQKIIVFCCVKGYFVASYSLLFLFGGFEKSFLSVQLVSCACILWGRCLLCLRSLSSWCFVVCFVGSDLFIFPFCRHLGIVSSSLLCPDGACSTSCLGCSSVWVFWAAFCRELSWGVV